MDDYLDIAEQFDSDSGIHIPPINQSTPTSQCFNKTAPLSLQQTYDKRKGHQNSSRYKVEPSKEDKECTFTPKINMYRNRNRGEFLDLQRGFVERKEMKLARMKEQLNHKESVEFTGRPTIDSQSNRIAQRTAGGPVFERLSRERDRSGSVEHEGKFQPRILGKSKSLTRNDPVGELLYSDAQRRIEKQKMTARESAKKHCPAPRINGNTDRLVTRGIKQEFDAFVDQSESVTPVIALTILSKLFNVDLNPKKDQQTQVTCEKILGYFDSKQHVRIVRLWQFIEGILGKVDDQSRQFTQQQQIDIYKSFGYFYRQRLTKVPRPVEQQPPSFQPEILKNSERLAAKKREKMLNEANNLLNHQNVGLSVDDTKDIALADLYILERMNKQQKHAQQRIENEQRALKECTFKPVINRNNLATSSNKQYPSKNTPIASSKYSSKKFKLKTQNNENTFGTLNTQYSCQKEHRNSVKHSTSKEAKIHQIKDIEKTVLRLSAARRDREYHNLIRQRGYPKDVDNWESYRVNEKRAVDNAHKELKGYCGEKKKAFVFDVHVGGGVIETIEVSVGQSLPQLVEVVAAKYDFDASKSSKLLEMMKYHLRLHTKGQDKENNNRTQPVSNE